MIARYWRGWTRPQDAENYEAVLKNKVLPNLKNVEGYRGGYVLRRDANEKAESQEHTTQKDGPGEVEFVVINFFESLDSVRRFAGPDYTVAVFEPEARQLLSRIEPLARHYEVRQNTAD